MYHSLRKTGEKKQEARVGPVKSLLPLKLAAPDTDTDVRALSGKGIVQLQ